MAIKQDVRNGAIHGVRKVLLIDHATNGALLSVTTGKLITNAWLPQGNRRDAHRDGVLGVGHLQQPDVILPNRAPGVQVVVAAGTKHVPFICEQLPSHLCEKAAAPCCDHDAVYNPHILRFCTPHQRAVIDGGGNGRGRIRHHGDVGRQEWRPGVHGVTRKNDPQTAWNFGVRREQSIGVMHIEPRGVVRQRGTQPSVYGLLVFYRLQSRGVTEP